MELDGKRLCVSSRLNQCEPRPSIATATTTKPRALGQTTLTTEAHDHEKRPPDDDENDNDDTVLILSQTNQQNSQQYSSDTLHSE